MNRRLILREWDDAGTGDQDCGEIVSRGLFASGGDLSEVLQFAEEPLDEVALAVDCRIDLPLDPALACSLRDLRELVSCLERHDLLRSASLDRLIIATLTKAREDVALGRTTCDDVLSPKPECRY